MQLRGYTIGMTEVVNCLSQRETPVKHASNTLRWPRITEPTQGKNIGQKSCEGLPTSGSHLATVYRFQACDRRGLGPPHVPCKREPGIFLRGLLQRKDVTASHLGVGSGGKQGHRAKTVRRSTSPCSPCGLEGLNVIC